MKVIALYALSIVACPWIDYLFLPTLSSTLDDILLAACEH